MSECVCLCVCVCVCVCANEDSGAPRSAAVQKTPLDPVGFGVQGSGFGVWGLGLRVQGSGYKFWGVGFRV